MAYDRDQLQKVNAAVSQQLGGLVVARPETMLERVERQLFNAQIEVTRLEELRAALKENPGVERVLNLLQVGPSEVGRY